MAAGKRMAAGERAVAWKRTAAWEMAKWRSLLYFCLRCFSDHIDQRQCGLVKEIANPNFWFREDAQRSFIQSQQSILSPFCGESRTYQCGNRIFSYDLAKKGEPVHSGHFQVKAHKVRPRLLHLLHRDQWISGDSNRHIRLLGKNGMHDLPHHCGVVYNQDLDWRGAATVLHYRRHHLFRYRQ